MRFDYTHKNTPAASRLVLIFAGWSATPLIFDGVIIPGYDTAVVWDYTDSGMPFVSQISGYGEIVVVAWSYGVPAAARFISGNPDLPVTARIAVNGTMHPVSHDFGISPEMFHATLQELTVRNLHKFRMRMCGGSRTFGEKASLFEDRPMEALRAELAAIGDREDPAPILWDKAVISLGDAIIPPAGQRRAWSREAVETIEIDGPHLPDFPALLSGIITDKSLVKRRFSSSRRSYESAASVQDDIAVRLADMLPPDIPDGAILEIGCGTGNSTRRLMEKTGAPDSRHSLQLWDLDIPSTLSFPGVSTCELDAESAVFTLPDSSLAMIYSASTLQWFNSLRSFLSQARRVLKPGGVLAFSTFGPQTMRQVHTSTVTVSRFPDLDAIRRMIPGGLTIEDSSVETMTLEFDSPLDVLRHIRTTGVNSLEEGPRSATLARRLLRDYPLSPSGKAPLTYQPMLFIIRKK